MSQKEVAISLQTCCYSEQLVNFYLDPLYLGLSGILKWYLLRGVTIPSLPPLIYSFSNKPSLQKINLIFLKEKKFLSLFLRLSNSDESSPVRCCCTKLISSLNHVASKILQVAHPLILDSYLTLSLHLLKFHCCSLPILSTGTLSKNKLSALAAIIELTFYSEIRFCMFYQD